MYVISPFEAVFHIFLHLFFDKSGISYWSLGASHLAEGGAKVCEYPGPLLIGASEESYSQDGS